MSKILILGASGQIGTELTLKLREIYGSTAVIASDIRGGNEELINSGPFKIIDATNYGEILEIVQSNNVSEVYLMAAMLSVTAEKYPKKAWNLNMNSLLHILKLAKKKIIKKVFWPSSIAVFGSTTPRQNTPQLTIMEPSTIYGISKLAGERWCAYYKKNHNVDVRSVRYPGIISWKTPPGGGTTDYAIEIYHKAITDNSYKCYLNRNSRLPMMYMEDAVNATVSLMQVDTPKDYFSYNITAINFTPDEIAKTIQKHFMDFKIDYSPDFRQKIADSWPESIDDSKAREDWNWQHKFDLEKMTEEMIKNLHLEYKS